MEKVQEVKILTMEAENNIRGNCSIRLLQLQEVSKLQLFIQSSKSQA